MIGLFTAALLLAPRAEAFIYAGNPTAGFQIDRPVADLTSGDAYVTKVRVRNCGGGYTDYQVQQSVDPVAGFQLTINGGDLCSATVYWGSVIYLDGSGFVIGANPSRTSVSLDPLKGGDVTPWHYLEGSGGSGTPVLDVTIQ